MIHLIDKAALVAEIERLENKLYYEPENFKDVGAKMALDSLKSSLDTLEVKEVDLEKEPAGEDLEQASRKYADDEEYGDDVYFSIKAAFKAGAQWQREQILKNAIECEVSQTMVDVIPMDSIEILPDGLFLDKSKFKVGDKVKVIVIPSE